MWEFFTELFSTKFMPHGHCFFWRPEILWLHVVSDLIIALAYYSIPVVLFSIVRKSGSRLPFRWVFILFGLFIFWCGTTHVFGIITLWVPIYRLDGLVKAITAAVSIATAVLLIPALPEFLSFARDSRARKNEEPTENY